MEIFDNGTGVAIESRPLIFLLASFCSEGDTGRFGVTIEEMADLGEFPLRAWETKKNSVAKTKRRYMRIQDKTEKDT